jgi:hypothetical protein
MLLGTRVTAYVIINADEHRRRAASGTVAVTDPALLDRHGPGKFDIPAQLMPTGPV